MAEKRRLMGEINVVPYIDVMLVLLIIFMVTAPLLTQGIEVNLPQANAAPLDAPVSDDTPPIVLSIDAAGAFYLNAGEDKDSPVAAADVIQRVRIILKRRPDSAVLVKADASVPHGRVVEGMVLLQQGGAAQVGIITDPITQEEGAP
ncbi:MAG: protein TolR [Pseudomonadota bacterium]